MTKIFISYRRDDSQHQADRLHAALKPYVSDARNNIFIDVDNIPIGIDFVEHLDRQVAQCDVLLALIGPGWLEARIAPGAPRRLDAASDFVRIEIASALKRGIPVVPVLLDGAPMPLESNLPEDLQALVRRNGRELKRLSFDSDVRRIAMGLGLIQETAPSVASARTVEPERVAFDMNRFVFLSYPNDTPPEVMRAIVRRLIADGVPVWLYDPVPFGFEPSELVSMRWQHAGQPWESQTLSALMQSRCVLALVNKTTDSARFQPREIDLAERHKPLVTVIIDDLRPEALPGNLKKRHAMRLMRGESVPNEKLLMMLSTEVQERVRDGKLDTATPGRLRRRLTFAAAILAVCALATYLALNYLSVWR